MSNSKQQKEIFLTNSKELFCKNLRINREQLQLTQKQIAQKLNLPVSTYANWEQGRTEPSIEDIFLIIKLLDIEANDLFSIN